MIYEMRVYTCAPGQLPVLLKRFEDTTLRIWKRLGIRPAGFLTTAVGPRNTDLTYFLAWDSLAEREEKWGQFMADEEWCKARAEHVATYGEVVTNIATSFMQPTAFSTGLL
ncbi:NIPSNAP family protein [Frigidibacter sp. ROC022]|uniref:NIPSNAP family protein n=1 Tax=Frigidibacter sp. ROC022 TaxID=2971796 RepID=UPI00215AEDF1|nr:NIPSNAP family protein [Frigidibacter sp. ROC022]MCR8724654.1 NIPSNAP family protein [Frigidibacter sp. ROC022]